MSVPDPESRLPESWEPELRQALDPGAATVRRVSLAALGPSRAADGRHRLLFACTIAAAAAIATVIGAVLLDAPHPPAARRPLITNVGRVVGTRDPAGHIRLRVAAEHSRSPSRAYILLKGEPR